MSLYDDTFHDLNRDNEREILDSDRREAIEHARIKVLLCAEECGLSFDDEESAFLSISRWLNGYAFEKGPERWAPDAERLRLAWMELLGVDDETKAADDKLGVPF